MAVFIYYLYYLLFYCEGGHTLEQIAQRAFIFRDIQNQTRHSPQELAQSDHVLGR